MDIQKQSNLVANEYDKNRRKFILCFDDFYIGTTSLIVHNIATPKTILDLGAGTGLLSQFWIQHYPTTKFVLGSVHIRASTIRAKYTKAKKITSSLS